MEKLKKFFTSVPGLILVFTIAAVPLVFGSIGSARAALTYYSDNYVSQVNMKDIGVTLCENGEEISYRNYDGDKADGTWIEDTGVLLEGMLSQSDGQLLFGKQYNEALSVKNKGSIDEYVRVTIYKYWVDKNNQKSYVLSPDLIDINITPVNGWVEDTSARTDERIVLYYTKILPTNSEPTPAFTDTLTINGNISGNVKVTVNDAGETVTTYNYNDYKFIIRCDVDGVQTHNAEPAIKSAWGKDVTISNGVITGGIQ